MAEKKRQEDEEKAQRAEKKRRDDEEKAQRDDDKRREDAEKLTNPPCITPLHDYNLTGKPFPI